MNLPELTDQMYHTIAESVPKIGTDLDFQDGYELGYDDFYRDIKPRFEVAGRNHSAFASGYRSGYREAEIDILDGLDLT